MRKNNAVLKRKYRDFKNQFDEESLKHIKDFMLTYINLIDLYYPYNYVVSDTKVHSFQNKHLNPHSFLDFIFEKSISTLDTTLATPKLSEYLKLVLTGTIVSQRLTIFLDKSNDFESYIKNKCIEYGILLTAPYLNDDDSEVVSQLFKLFDFQVDVVS